MRAVSRKASTASLVSGFAAKRFTVADLLMADVLRVAKLRAHGHRPATEAYVAQAVALAHDTPRLRALRERVRMAGVTRGLFDPRRTARGIEDAVDQLCSGISTPMD